MYRRGAPEARAREWTQHLTDFMDSALAERRARFEQRTTASAQTSPGTMDEADGAQAEGGGWLQLDLSPLLGRCTETDQPCMVARGEQLTAKPRAFI